MWLADERLFCLLQPWYLRGYKVLISICCLAVAAFAFTWWFFGYEVRPTSSAPPLSYPPADSNFSSVGVV